MEKIGRYEIKQEIGRGGMAVVYLAVDPRMKRDVAIKVLPRQFTHDATFRGRFEREAQTIAALEHSNIVPIHDYGEEDDQPYLVMRHMSGGSLHDRLQAGQLSLPEIIDILEQIAAGLDHAHSKGIVHRDLKPSNILFDQYDRARIADFGIVKIEESNTNYTGDKMIGTAAYMSPEQVQTPQGIDHRSDIYSLGIMLFEMLSGQVPFNSDTPFSLAIKHINDPLPDILALSPELPKRVRQVFEKALAKQPSARFPDAITLKKELQQALETPDLDATIADDSEKTIPDIPAEIPPDPNKTEVDTDVLIKEEESQPEKVEDKEEKESIFQKLVAAFPWWQTVLAFLLVGGVRYLTDIIGTLPLSGNLYFYHWDFALLAFFSLTLGPVAGFLAALFGLSLYQTIEQLFTPTSFYLIYGLFGLLPGLLVQRFRPVNNRKDLLPATGLAMVSGLLISILYTLERAWQIGIINIWENFYLPQSIAITISIGILLPILLLIYLRVKMVS